MRRSSPVSCDRSTGGHNTREPSAISQAAPVREHITCSVRAFLLERLPASSATRVLVAHRSGTAQHRCIHCGD